MAISLVDIVAIADTRLVLERSRGFYTTSVQTIYCPDVIGGLARTYFSEAPQ